MASGYSRLYRFFDIALMALMVVFFAGYINIHSELLGLPHFLPVSIDVEKFWDIFTWLIFSLLAFDIYLKYRKTGDLRVFLKKYWLEIVMLTMIPLFVGLKIGKFSIKLVKGLKMMKSGFKVAHGAKKISKAQKTSESS